MPVEHHRALGHIVETRDEVDNRRLAGPCLPDERNRLARRDSEVDASQHRAILLICEGDVIESDRTCDSAEVWRAGWIARFGSFIEDTVDAFRPCEGRLHLGVYLRDELNRAEKLLHIDEVCREQAHRERAVKHEIAPVADDDSGGKAAEYVNRGREGGGDAHCLNIRVTVRRIARAEAGDVRLGAVKGLRLTDARDLLLQPRRDIANRLACQAAGAARTPREGNGDGDHHRDNREADERHREVEREHDDDDADEAEQAAEQLRQPLREQLIERVYIIEHAAH